MTLDQARFAAMLALCLIMAACAQTGPPLPPSLELPKPPGDLRATRKGSRVTLSWTEPILTTDRQSVRFLGPTLVCRDLAPEMTACGLPAAKLSAPSSNPQLPSSKKASQKKSAAQRQPPEIYTDTLPAAMQRPDPAADVTYAVEVLNRNARGAGLSNRVHVPAIITLPPPNDLAPKLTADGVVLTWTSAAEPPNAANAVQYRYRIYRRDQSSGKDAIAGEIPVPSNEPQTTQFTDSTFEWEKTYLYRVTAVSLLRRPESEVQVEGDDSSSVQVIAHDIFPPAVPTGLQAAYSGEGQKPFIDLVWAPVTTADLAGYNIYRSKSNDAYEKVNEALLKSPSYRDSAVVSGKTYTYIVSAVDVRGNESQRSDPASEPVP
ncbi:MAG: hypothetical protein ABSD53_01845 [Terriglobales bacterium]|jgi:hypothetical protein